MYVNKDNFINQVKIATKKENKKPIKFLFILNNEEMERATLEIIENGWNYILNKYHPEIANDYYMSKNLFNRIKDYKKIYDSLIENKILVVKNN